MGPSTPCVQRALEDLRVVETSTHLAKDGYNALTSSHQLVNW